MLSRTDGLQMRENRMFSALLIKQSGPDATFELLPPESIPPGDLLVFNYPNFYLGKIRFSAGRRRTISGHQPR